MTTIICARSHRTCGSFRKFSSPDTPWDKSEKGLQVRHLYPWPRFQASSEPLCGEKLTAIANQWDGRLVFLHDGRMEMDSNFVENRIRPVKLTVEHALFAGHDEGAAALGRIASLATTKMNGVEPYA